MRLEDAKVRVRNKSSEEWAIAVKPFCKFKLSVAERRWRINSDRASTV